MSIYLKTLPKRSHLKKQIKQRNKSGSRTNLWSGVTVYLALISGVETLGLQGKQTLLDCQVFMKLEERKKACLVPPKRMNLRSFREEREQW